MKQISNCKLEIQGYESKLEEIQSQMASARAHAAILSKVKYLKEFMEDLKRKKEDGISTLSDDYRSVFARSFDFEDEFKMKFDSKVSEVTQLYDMSFKKIDEYKENARKVSDELNRVVESRKTVVSEHSRIENLLKAIHLQYVKLYEDDITFIEFVTDYSGLLEDTELSHKEDESKLQNSESFMKLYGDAKKHCQTRGECVLCKTHFNAAQTSEFIASMESAIQNLKKFEAIKSRLEANEAFLFKMRKYLDDAVKYVKMDVKAFDNEISIKQQQLDAANKKVNDAAKSLKELEITRNTLRKLADTILELNRIKDDLQEKSREIERLNDDVQTQSLMAGTSATPDELEEEQTAINKKVKSSRNKLDNLNKTKELELHKITKAENNIKDLKLSISNMEMKSASKINIENSIKELTQEIEKQSDSLRETKKQLYNANAELKNKMSEYSRFKQESDDTKSKLQKEVDEMGVVKFKLARLDQEISDFVKSGGEAQFETVKETSKSLQDQINAIETQIRAE
ncbi:unnamed protein product [Ambrosiozyma monospora]|uniref:Unnamed protein product n=1 Tax=Ambrosiozyma monospora TaxID=43982 RepID=A0ACB5T7C0_AMBMO|nr:unnamed protein product [Ambrosiozyma monospora]